MNRVLPIALVMAWMQAAALAAPEPAQGVALAAPAASSAAAVAGARQGLRERAEKGQAQSQYDYGITLLCRRPPDALQAARWMSLAADQGHRGSQSVLGWMYMSGMGVKRDDALAARWLRPSAQGGDTAAQNNLGVLYAVGRGVEHDHAQAEQWFRAAADKGAADAQHNLQVLTRNTASAPERAAARPAVHPAVTAAGCRRAAAASRT